MNEQQEALELALEALELALSSHGVMLLSDPPQDSWKTRGVESKSRQAITAIKKALAQPAQRPWAGLTDEEIVKIISSNNSTGLWQMAIQIESALKSKNT